MTGITVGKPWPEGEFKNLRIAPYVDDPAHLDALAAVVNATRGTAWPAAWVARYYGHPAFELERDARLAWLGSAPVAAAICYPMIHLDDRPPGNFEIFVVPAARGHGLGGRLLAHLEEAARARGHHVLETTIDHADDPGRRFLLAHGFRVIGQSAHLTRPTMEDLPATDLPSGFAISSLDDVPDAAYYYQDLANRLGAYDPGYNLIEPEERDALRERADWEPEGVFVLSAPDGREVGVIRASGARRAEGYLHEIGIDPAFRGQGLGRALVGAALAYLAAHGVQETALDTEGPDTAPYRLALRCGFQETNRWQQLLKPLTGAAG